MLTACATQTPQTLILVGGAEGVKKLAIGWQSPKSKGSLVFRRSCCFAANCIIVQGRTFFRRIIKYHIDSTVYVRQLGGQAVTHAGNRAAAGLHSARGTSDWLELATLLESCSHRIRRIVSAAAEPFDLSDRQAMILWLCAADPDGSAQNELAWHLTLSPPQLCHLLDQLRGRGLLESSRDPRDRRRQRTRLTGKGTQVWRELEQSLRTRLAEFSRENPGVEPAEWNARLQSPTGPAADPKATHTGKEAA